MGLCECESSNWQSLHNGQWNSFISPYEKRYIDVRVKDQISTSFSLSIQEGNFLILEFFFPFDVYLQTSLGHARIVAMLIRPITRYLPLMLLIVNLLIIISNSMILDSSVHLITKLMSFGKEKEK